MQAPESAARPKSGSASAASIVSLTSDEEIRAFFSVYRVLRPDLAAAGFVEKIQRQRSQGFELVGIYAAVSSSDSGAGSVGSVAFATTSAGQGSGSAAEHGSAGQGSGSAAHTSAEARSTVEGGRAPASLMGFRFLETTAWGRILYIDDLVTSPEFRGQGHASTLLDYALARAEQADCDQIHLDSGPSRHDAHRLYLNKGFHISSHHFSRPLRQ